MIRLNVYCNINLNYVIEIPEKESIEIYVYGYKTVSDQYPIFFAEDSRHLTCVGMNDSLILNLSNITLQNGDDGGGLEFYGVIPRLEVSAYNVKIIGTDNLISTHGGGVRIGSAVKKAYINGLIICNINISGYRGAGIDSEAESLYIENTTITKCSTAQNGGGINISAGNDATISNVKIIDNIADLGAGIFATGTKIDIISGEINGNSAGNMGGGIYCNKDLTIQKDVNILYNRAVSNGGGVAVLGGNCEVTGGKIYYNESGTEGGGVYFSGLTAYFKENVQIFRNSALDAGGGIFVNQPEKFEIENSEIFNNTSKNGGGIATMTKIQLKNTVIKNNEALLNGGGIYIGVVSDLDVLEETVIKDNVSSNGAGIYHSANSNKLSTIVMDDDVIIEKNIASASGGGIYCLRTIDIKGGNINENSARDGGGIYNGFTASTASKINVEGVSIYKNIATENGGGVYTNNGRFAFEGSVLKNNIAQGSGGGFYDNAIGTTNNLISTIFSDTEILENEAGENGGGIYILGRHLIIKGAEITHNTAEGSGGGFYVKGKVDIEDVSIDSNSAGEHGGGGYIVDNFIDTSDNDKEYGLSLKSSVVSNNTAGKNGGGLFTEGGLINAQSVSFTENKAAAHGGAVGVPDIDFDKYWEYIEVDSESDFSGNTAVTYVSFLSAANQAIHDNHIHVPQGKFSAVDGIYETLDIHPDTGENKVPIKKMFINAYSDYDIMNIESSIYRVEYDLNFKYYQLEPEINKTAVKDLHHYITGNSLEDPQGEIPKIPGYIFRGWSFTKDSEKFDDDFIFDKGDSKYGGYLEKQNGWGQQEEWLLSLEGEWEPSPAGTPRLTKEVIKVENDDYTSTDERPIEVQRGDKVTYSLTIENTKDEIAGEQTYLHIDELVDKLPTGLTYKGPYKVSDLAGTIKYPLLAPYDNIKIDEEEGIITIKDLHLYGGESITIEFIVSVDADAIGVINNEAKATVSYTDGTTDPNKVEDDDQIKVPSSYSLEKDADRKHVFVGDKVEYQVKLTNLARSNGWTGTITDVYPAGTKYVKDSMKINYEGTDKTSDEISDIVNFSATGFEVTVTGLAKDKSIIITYQLEVEKLIRNDGKLTNIVTSTPNETNPEILNDTETVTGQLCPGKLEIVKNVVNAENNSIDRFRDSKAPLVEHGEYITYSIRAKNMGVTDSILLTTEISDLMPEGLQYVDGTAKLIVGSDGAEANIALDPNLQVDTAAGEDGTRTKITYTYNSKLYGGEYVTIKFMALVKDEAQGGLVNSASGSAKVPSAPAPDDPSAPNIIEFEPAAPDNPEDPEYEGEHTTKVLVKGPLITINKETDKSLVEIGDVLNYTLVVKNSRSEDGAAGAVWSGIVIDTLPKGVQFVPGSLKFIRGTAEQTINNESDYVKGATIEVPISKLAIDGSYTIKYQLKITAPAETENEIENPYTITNNAVVKNDKSDETPLDEDETKTKVLYKRGELYLRKDVYAAGDDKLEGKGLEGSEVEVGNKLTYKVEVKNAAAEDTILDSVTVIDTLPYGVVYMPDTFKVDGKKAEVKLSVDDDGCQVLTYTVKNVLTSVILTFDVEVTEKASGDIDNIANATYIEKTPSEDPEKVDEPEVTEEIPYEPKDSDKDKDRTTHNKVKEPDLTIEKTAATGKDRDYVYVGETVLYTVTLSSIIPQTGAFTGYISDTLPEEIRFLSGSLVIGGTRIPAEEEGSYINGNTITIPVNELLYNESLTFRYEAVVNILKSEIINVAEAQDVSGNTVMGWSTGNQDWIRDSALVAVEEMPDPYLSKNTEKAGKTVFVGDVIDYTVELAYVGTDKAAWSGVIRDDYPEGTSYVNGSMVVKIGDGIVSEDKIIHTQDGYRIHIDSLWGGEAVTVAYQLRAEKLVENRVLKNTVYAVPDTLDPDDFDPAHEDVRIDTTIVYETECPGKLDIRKDVFAENDQKLERSIAGNTTSYEEVVIYAVTAKNAEPAESILNSVTIQDTMPEGIAYVANSFAVNGVSVPDEDPAFTITEKNDIWSFTYIYENPLSGGDTVLLTFRATVLAIEGEALTNVAGGSAVVPSDPDFPDVVEEIPFQPENPEDGTVTIYGPRPEVTIEKSATEVILAGDLILYKLEVSNKMGTAPFSGMVLDRLPEEIDLIENTVRLDGKPVSSEVADGVLKIEISIPAGQLAEVTFAASVNNKVRYLDGTAVITNTVTVNESEDSEPLDDAEADTLMYQKQGQLSLEKDVIYTSDGPDYRSESSIDGEEVERAESLLYAITVRNTGEEGSILSEVKVIDTLPEGVTYVKDSFRVNGEKTEPVTGTGNDGSCVLSHTIYNLMEQAVITFCVVVEEQAEGRLVNTAGAIYKVYEKDAETSEIGEKALVYIPKGDEHKTVNQIRENTAGRPEVTIEKTAAKSILMGEEIQYTLLVDNEKGNAPFSGLVTDPLPDEIDLIESTVKIDGVSVEYTLKDGILSIPVVVAAGESVAVTFTATVNERISFTDGAAVITNKAEVRDSKEQEPLDESRDSTIVYQPGKLYLEKDVMLAADGTLYDPQKTVDGKEVDSAEELLYAIIVRNAGDAGSVLRNVKVVDELPAGVEYIENSFCVDGETVKPEIYTDKDGRFILTFEIQELAEEAILTFRVKVTEQAEKELVNIANASSMIWERHADTSEMEEKEVSYEPSGDENKTVNPLKKVSSKPDVTLEKTATRHIYANEKIVYTLLAGNENGETVFEGVVTDKLPVEINLIEDSVLIAEKAAVYALEDGLLSVPVSIEPGEVLVITFEAEVNELLTFTEGEAVIRNTAEIRETENGTPLDDSEAVTKVSRDPGESEPEETKPEETKPEETKMEETETEKRYTPSNSGKSDTSGKTSVATGDQDLMLYFLLMAFGSLAVLGYVTLKKKR